MNLTLTHLKQAYATGEITPRQLVKQLLNDAKNYGEHNIFIHLLNEAELEPYLTILENSHTNSMPLWGVPFVIKDNIDLAGIATTAACPAFSFVPEKSAFVVQQLIDAGAIPIGKTNMDQFATGLVGTRSPYGVCHNAFDFDKISGGSSSGSAVALALNLCSFSLGTDTAGSGRVPAAFNNLVGLKPSKGLLSTSGLLPAVRSQDAMSIFTLNAQDAYQIFEIASAFDKTDEYARPELNLMPPAWPAKPVIGIPDKLSFYNDDIAKAQFLETLKTLKSLGYEIKEVNFDPWIETAKLLYGGAWVAERYTAISAFFDAHESDMDLAVAKIIAGAKTLTAQQAYQGNYDLQKAQRLTQSLWQTVDCMLTPTTPTIFSIKELQADPIQLNSVLGTYTNFMNLLDYAAVALPTGFRSDNLPAGITLFAPAGSDRQLLALSDHLQTHFVKTSGAKKTPLPEPKPEIFSTPHHIPLAVVGAHLTGFPLNNQLIERGAKLIKTTQTAPKYAFYELAGGSILKPGLVKINPEIDPKGVSIEVEVWSMPKHHLGSFLALIPSPLGLGKVELIDGSQVVGFICEPIGLVGATHISNTGGWRNWMKVRNT